MPTETGGDANASQNPNSGVANPNPNAKTPPKRDPALSARDELLARMDAQIVEQRSDDDETFFQQGDPRAIALAAEMGRESRGQPIAADRGQGRSAAAGEEAEQIQQDAGEAQADEAETQAERAVRISDKGDDPLSEYVVREGGKAMFKTVVDGKTVLVPLDRARQQLQKHLAADIRLQQAADRQRGLDAREAQLRTTESTLRARAAQPVVTPIDDATLEAESVELVRSLVSQPEAVAAKRMSDTLKKIRASAPQVDVNAIATQAAQVARQTIAAEDNSKALVNGLTDFTKNYPDIAADSDLYALADRKTTAIAAEHPDWTPGQVMDEAGKQTREWVAGISGKPAPKPNGQGQQPNNRQLAKQNLRPMPQTRSVRPAAAAETQVDSPSDALAEIRKSRGQPY